MSFGRWVGLALLVSLGVGSFPGKPKADVPTDGDTSTREANDPLHDVVTEHGRRAVGVYLPGVYFRRHSVEEVVELVERTRSNAVVIDIKDGAGRVTYDTQIEILEDQQVNYLGDARQVISDLKEAGIYTIARIVCFADPQLPGRHPDRAIMHYRRPEPWVSWGTGGTWLDPYNRANHDMIVELTQEAASLGFDELQLDYIRFPVDDGTQYAIYPAEDDTERPALLIELLDRIDRAVRVPLGVDVFGLAAYREGDPSGLGQDLNAWAAHVDVISPMLYINSMRAWEVGRPDRSRRLVETGVARLRERIGPDMVIRPFLQAFERGAGHEGFNPRFIARQIVGARRGGADGFLMWHPGARYSMFRRGMQGPARGVAPFPLRAEYLEHRAEQRSEDEEPEETEEHADAGVEGTESEREPDEDEAGVTFARR